MKSMPLSPNFPDGPWAEGHGPDLMEIRGQTTHSPFLKMGNE